LKKLAPLNIEVSDDMPDGTPNEVNMPVLPMPDGIEVKPVDESPWSPLSVGKAIFNDSRSVALAVSWLNAVVVPVCTIAGKPNEVPIKLACDTATAAPMADAMTNKMHNALNIPIFYPLLKST
jgi:hypothetical protein